MGATLVALRHPFAGTDANHEALKRNLKLQVLPQAILRRVDHGVNSWPG